MCFWVCELVSLSVATLFPASKKPQMFNCAFIALVVTVTVTLTVYTKYTILVHLQDKLILILTWLIHFFIGVTDVWFDYSSILPLPSPFRKKTPDL